MRESGGITTNTSRKQYSVTYSPSLTAPLATPQQILRVSYGFGDPYEVLNTVPTIPTSKCLWAALK